MLAAIFRRAVVACSLSPVIRSPNCVRIFRCDLIWFSELVVRVAFAFVAFVDILTHGDCYTLVRIDMVCEGL